MSDILSIDNIKFELDDDCVKVELKGFAMVRQCLTEGNVEGAKDFFIRTVEALDKKGLLPEGVCKIMTSEEFIKMRFSDDITDDDKSALYRKWVEVRDSVDDNSDLVDLLWNTPELRDAFLSATEGSI